MLGSGCLCWPAWLCDQDVGCTAHVCDSTASITHLQSLLCSRTAVAAATCLWAVQQLTLITVFDGLQHSCFLGSDRITLLCWVCTSISRHAAAQLAVHPQLSARHVDTAVAVLGSKFCPCYQVLLKGEHACCGLASLRCKNIHSSS